MSYFDYFSSVVRLSIIVFKCFLLWKHLSNFDQISVGTSMSRGIESLFEWLWLAINMVIVTKNSKNLKKIFFLRTIEGISMKLCSDHSTFRFVYIMVLGQPWSMPRRPQKMLRWANQAHLGLLFFVENEYMSFFQSEWCLLKKGIQTFCRQACCSAVGKLLYTRFLPQARNFGHFSWKGNIPRK